MMMLTILMMVLVTMVFMIVGAAIKMIMMVVVEVAPSDIEEEQIVFSKMGRGLQSVDDNGDNCENDVIDD